MTKKRQYKIKLSMVWITALALVISGIRLAPIARAVHCPDLRIVFARGSGEERWTNQNYLEFKKTLESKLATISLDYEFIDLDYPAIGVGIENIDVALGAFFGGGENYAFGESMNLGVSNLTAMVNGGECPNTKYVLGGYSQGAMAISKSLNGLNSERIIYAATFGDPKIYLPEGMGIIPAACRGENLSDYRMHVPDCRAYKGLLGAYIPYKPAQYTGKLGTWCNKMDIFCSSFLSITDHVNYTTSGLYEDASRLIFDKITKHFGIENKITSPHDTAFLIDSTGSMAEMIGQYKEEALRLATETLNAGGRVALYDYRDLADPYQPQAHCDFTTCTLETFKAGLNNIQADGGGDLFESLLSSSLKMMKSLEWKFGATKSLVVLTDAGYLAPDRDGVTINDVVKLSKQIDPVNFYIITNDESAEYYNELARDTDGKVVTNFNELGLLTEYIMQRYDSLPRVEEEDTGYDLPSLTVLQSEKTSDGGVRIKFESTGEQALVVLNDQILGRTSETEIIIEGLDLARNNEIMLVPMTNERRGNGVMVLMDDLSLAQIPKAPNTGKR